MFVGFSLQCCNVSVFWLRGIQRHVSRLPDFECFLLCFVICILALSTLRHFRHSSLWYSTNPTIVTVLIWLCCVSASWFCKTVKLVSVHPDSPDLSALCVCKYPPSGHAHEQHECNFVCHSSSLLSGVIRPKLNLMCSFCVLIRETQSHIGFLTNAFFVWTSTVCIFSWRTLPCALPGHLSHNPEDESGSRVSGETRETLQQGTNHAAPDSWLRDATMGWYSVVLQNKIYVGTEYLGKTFSNWWVQIMQCQTRCYYRMLWCYNGIHTRRVGT